MLTCKVGEIVGVVMCDNNLWYQIEVGGAFWALSTIDAKFLNGTTIFGV